MSIVNFTIPKQLDQKVNKIIREKGFGSKAEFFRFAAIYFIDVIQKPISTEEQRFEYLTTEIQNEIATQYTGKKLPALDQQLS